MLRLFVYNYLPLVLVLGNTGRKKMVLLREKLYALLFLYPIVAVEHFFQENIVAHQSHVGAISNFDQNIILDLNEIEVLFNRLDLAEHHGSGKTHSSNINSTFNNIQETNPTDELSNDFLKTVKIDEENSQREIGENINGPLENLADGNILSTLAEIKKRLDMVSALTGMDQSDILSALIGIKQLDISSALEGLKQQSDILSALTGIKQSDILSAVAGMKQKSGILSKLTGTEQPLEILSALTGIKQTDIFSALAGIKQQSDISSSKSFKSNLANGNEESNSFVNGACSDKSKKERDEHSDISARQFEEKQSQQTKAPEDITMEKNSENQMEIENENKTSESPQRSLESDHSVPLTASNQNMYKHAVILSDAGTSDCNQESEIKIIECDHQLTNISSNCHLKETCSEVLSTMFNLEYTEFPDIKLILDKSTSSGNIGVNKLFTTNIRGSKIESSDCIKKILAITKELCVTDKIFPCQERNTENKSFETDNMMVKTENSQNSLQSKKKHRVESIKETSLISINSNNSESTDRNKTCSIGDLSARKSKLLVNEYTAPTMKLTEVNIADNLKVASENSRSIAIELNKHYDKYESNADTPDSYEHLNTDVVGRGMKNEEDDFNSTIQSLGELDFIPRKKSNLKTNDQLTEIDSTKLNSKVVSDTSDHNSNINPQWTLPSGNETEVITDSTLPLSVINEMEESECLITIERVVKDEACDSLSGQTNAALKMSKNATNNANLERPTTNLSMYFSTTEFEDKVKSFPNVASFRLNESIRNSNGQLKTGINFLCLANEKFVCALLKRKVVFPTANFDSSEEYIKVLR